MKKLFFYFFLLLLLTALIWLGFFYWKNLRGISPAILPPPQNITKIINTTGMPLKIPAGFEISIFAEGLEKPRVLALDPNGTLLASITSQGRVVAMPDKNSDGVADEIKNVITGLDRPHGLAFAPCGNKTCLLIAETHRAQYNDYDAEKQIAASFPFFLNLPAGGNHFTRTLLIPGKGKRPLVSVGSSCNVCNETDFRRAAIVEWGDEPEEWNLRASGLRNSVFMALHPVTGQVWATEMGRDLLGDDLPPDEINIIEKGKNYGWPYCYGKQIHDKDFDPAGSKKEFCEKETVSSHIDLPAHSAPLGLAFINKGWPKEWQNDLLVAFHGSWNRSVPTGYKIVRFPLDARGNIEGEPVDFISGWLTKEGALGRPVDLLIQPNGNLYISDDKAGVIYRMGYAK